MSKSHGCKINLKRFVLFLKKFVTNDKLKELQNSPFFVTNAVQIRLIADGCDIWSAGSQPCLLSFAHLYRTHYSALPTNTQFTERGVKESGYVSLGRRSEKNRTVLATARALVVPDAMSEGREEIKKDDGKKRIVQGKLRARVLMTEALSHQNELDLIENQDPMTYQTTHEDAVKFLTYENVQFKKERIDKKVRNYKEKEQSTTRRGIRTTQQRKYDLTPLLQGKIQFGKMRKESNMEQVRGECNARNLQYDANTNWNSLLQLIKENERNNKYFKPITDYNLFKWNETHFD